MLLLSLHMEVFSVAALSAQIPEHSQNTGVDLEAARDIDLQIPKSRSVDVHCQSSLQCASTSNVLIARVEPRQIIFAIGVLLVRLGTLENVYNVYVALCGGEFTPASMSVNPTNLAERIFAVSVVVFALVGFSYLVGSITGPAACVMSEQGQTCQVCLYTKVDGWMGGGGGTLAGQGNQCRCYQGRCNRFVLTPLSRRTPAAKDCFGDNFRATTLYQENRQCNRQNFQGEIKFSVF